MPRVAELFLFVGSGYNIVIMPNEAIKDLLTRGVEEVVVKEHLEAALKSKKKLRVKLGIDPTSPNIHIGRAVILWKLRAFQELGHKVVLIVGDFTGLIGDTSDKDSERPMLEEKTIQTNLKSYFAQAFKILDKTKTETHYNSAWLKKLGFKEIGKMADLFGLHEFEARENIHQRLKAGKRVSVRELLYPLMQGYDSVAVKADIELGGTDQRFNLLAGRPIQKAYGAEPQDILTMTLLEGTDGRKMSSSWGNVVNIVDEPNDMFGKIMSISDDLIKKYFLLATCVPLTKVAKIMGSEANPRDQKFTLAREITTLYHGKKIADKAAAKFNSVFSKKEVPSDSPAIKLPGKSIGLLELLLKTGVTSKSEARRLIEQGAVEIDGEKHGDFHEVLRKSTPFILKIGKTRFFKIIA